MKIHALSISLVLIGFALTGCVGDAVVYTTTPDSGDPGKDAGLPDSPDDLDAGDASPTPDASDAGADVETDAGAADASDAAVLTCDAGTTVCGNLCVDTTADDKNCGSCGHDCQGGGCFMSLCMPTTLANQTGAYGIAVDSTNVYWTDYTSTGSVQKIPIGGGSPTTLAANQTSPYTIAVDGTNVYWTTQNGAVMKTPTGGGSLTTLANGMTNLKGLAVDSTSVYWTVDFGTHGVMKCATGGCSNTPTTIISGQTGPYGVAVDATNVYLTNYEGSVMKCATSGCGGNPTTLVPTQTPYYFQWVAVDATNVYWTSDSGSVQKCAIGGCNGTPTVLATTTTKGAFGIATDGVNVYWVGGGANGKVQKCAVGGCGGNPTTLVYNQNDPRMIAVDSKNIYWTNYANGQPGGQVMKVAK